MQSFLIKLCKFWCFDSFFIIKAIWDWGELFGIHGKAMESREICHEVFLMTVMSATFGALTEVHFLHSIYHFKAKEVKNLILQTVCDSELKRRSYSHCKQITLKCCEISLLLQSDFVALFVRLRNLADLVFTCEMVLSASWYLRPTLWDIFLQIFVV